MLFEVNAQCGGALDYVVSVYAAGESFVLHFLSHGFGFHFRQRLPWFDQSAGGDESGQFVAGKERFLQRRLARHTGVLGVRHDGFANLVRPATLFQNLVPFVRVIFPAGIFLVVEIVDKADHAPEIFVSSQLAGVGAHARFHRQGVLA